ncbi:histidine triad family protein (homolog to bis(5'-nucleosyl)-tetraphosphatase) [Natronomonas pharaonis DSM 2160]|uniref:Histidine triad family protein (Homolog to bis(5'-nucleosyl)-tetraphosphatase) n=1 Tax=Natronomonas pharaonis (strain ATCC 35678 / DSM 2160 / CIP 103997 / JCM 8858 / NBRC 14720 / NCIMB 2260 / Gabara) TaxID=348780 RepID=A0A1U7EZD0_NATPD|nr:HIT family protein [Natronomonas pharaonis]CAI50636.1 histidine triad family protein (homolog to bis(5'-nucleosyl)-tetraphosphatase) [Natronomonas pharaonis DSM 2160]
MSDRTIFEQIIDGDIPARIVHETETTLAFLDANPLAPGHTLVVPKEPYERLRDLPPELSADVFETVRTVTPAVQDAVDADATTIGINDGPEAGQEVPHLHVHIVPRFEGDGGGPIHGVAGKTPELGDEELDTIADDIAEGLD